MSSKQYLRLTIIMHSNQYSFGLIRHKRRTKDESIFLATDPRPNGYDLSGSIIHVRVILGATWTQHRSSSDASVGYGAGRDIILVSNGRSGDPGTAGSNGQAGHREIQPQQSNALQQSGRYDVLTAEFTETAQSPATSIRTTQAGYTDRPALVANYLKTIPKAVCH